MRLIDYLCCGLISAAVFSGASLFLRFHPGNLGLIGTVIFIMIMALIGCILSLSYPGRTLLSKQTGCSPDVWVGRISLILVGFIVAIVGSIF